MVYTFYPTFIKSIELSKKYGQLKDENKISDLESDSKFRFFLEENAQFTESRLWFLFHQDIEQYQKTVEGSSRFAFIFFPLILWQYYDLRKLNRHLHKRLKNR